LQHLKKYFDRYPIIPAIRDIHDLDKAMSIKEATVIFLLTGTIFDLELAMQKAKDNDKILIVNVDLIDGISTDKVGIRYLAEKYLCDGIISTRNYLLKAANTAGLMTVQRIFMLDSGSLKTAINIARQDYFDAVEILPGLAAPYFMEHLSANIKLPIIAGGLVENKEEIKELTKKGVIAISTSEQTIW